MGIDILPPDINESYENFTVSAGGIRFGLGAIKNVGINAVKSIVTARKKEAFTSLFDFCQRVDQSQINKRVMENLIVAGCFDSLQISRKQALSIMDECMDLASQIKRTENSQQISLFGDSSELIIEEPRSKVKGEMEKRERLSREKEVLGFYVSENPLDQYRNTIPLLITEELGELEKDLQEGYVRVAGLASELSKKVSRKGEPYARFVLEDLSGRMEMMIFASVYQKTINKIEPDQLLIIEGFVDRRDEAAKISVRNIATPNTVLKDLHIRLPDEKDDFAGRQELVAKLAEYPGDIEVVLHLPNRKVLVLTENFNVAPSLQLKQELSVLYGKGTIWYS